ncbi:hypothetical protein [Moorena sp. SIO2C4]|nr:hypothetical protein [Moorena sp. SIO2C4]
MPFSGSDDSRLPITDSRAKCKKPTPVSPSHHCLGENRLLWKVTD